MPTQRILMRQIRESLRLHLQAMLSYNEVGRTLKLSKSVVGKYMSLARVAGVDWNIAQTLSDQELQARLYKAPLTRNSKQEPPDFADVHQELKRAGVTLQLLWEEYAKGNNLAFKYTSFCVKYREWAMGIKRSMRQIHIAGEKLFVDYAGQTVPLSQRGHICYDWQHYIALIQRKPGALRNSAPFADMPPPLLRLRQGLMRHDGGDKTMAQVLNCVVSHDLEAVLVAVELVIESDVLSTEHVLNVLARLNASELPQSVESTQQLK